MTDPADLIAALQQDLLDISNAGAADFEEGRLEFGTHIGESVWNAITRGPFDSSALLHIQEQQTANTSGHAGATFTQGGWRTRFLNTILTNDITGASLASNQVTLPTGTYETEFSSPAYRVDRHKVKLVTTDPADIIIGTSSICGSGNFVGTRSFGWGRFTIVSEKVFEVQHRCQDSEANNGFGLESNFSVVEVYTDLKIWKIG